MQISGRRSRKTGRARYLTVGTRVNQDYFALLLFDLLILCVLLGSVVMAISIIESKLRQCYAAAAIGSFGALVLAAGQPKEPCLLQGLFWIPQGAAIAVLFGLLVRNVLAVRETTFLFGLLGAIGNGLKSSLAPRRWSEAAEMPSISQRDLTKRIFVAVSAGTGGVVGSLMSLGLFWETLQTDFGVRGLFNTLVMSAVSVTLIGPLHEYIMDRGLDTKSTRHDVRVESIFHEFSPKSLLRVAMVVGMFFMLDMTQASLAKCVRDGNLDAMLLIVLGGITPALVSYYWCAALQLGAPSISIVRAATWPSIVAGAVMFSILSFAASIVISTLWGVFEPRQGDSGFAVIAQMFLSVLGLTCGLALGFSLLTCGIYALAGGYAIDKVKGRNAWGALSLALVLATVPQQSLGNWVLSTFGDADHAGQSPPAKPLAPTLTPIAAALQSYGICLCAGAEQPQPEAPHRQASFVAPGAPPKNTFLDWLTITILERVNLLLGTAGWLAGLYASGFPDLLRRKADPTPPIAES